MQRVSRLAAVLVSALVLAQGSYASAQSVCSQYATARTISIQGGSSSIFQFSSGDRVTVTTDNGSGFAVIAPGLFTAISSQPSGTSFTVGVDTLGAASLYFQAATATSTVWTMGCTGVAQAPTVNSLSMQALTVAYNATNASISVSSTINGTTGTPTGYSVISNATTGGGTVSINSTGTATYSPANGFHGNDTFQFYASNAQGNSANVTVMVPVGDPTLTASLPAVAATVGASYSQAVTIAGGKAPYASFSATGLPPGLTISSSGVISGTPTAAGTYSNIIVTATDSSVGPSGPSPFTGNAAAISLTVTPGALTTTLAVPSITLTAGTAATPFTPVTATGGVGTLTYTVIYGLQAGALPAGLSFSTSTGQITGTPTSVLPATSITVFVVDTNKQASSQTFRLTIVAPPLTTTQAVPSTTLTLGTAATPFTPVTASGGAGPLTYALSGGSLPAGLSFSADTGEITGTPTGSLGATTFTVTVTDQSTPTHLTSAKTFQLTVVPRPLTISEAPGLKLIPIGESASLTPVIATGGLGTLTYTISGGALPNGLSLSSTSGQITGTVASSNDLSVNLTVTVTDQSTPPQTASQNLWLHLREPVLYMRIYSGDNEHATLGDKFKSGIKVQVLDDIGSAPVSGVDVTFSVNPQSHISFDPRGTGATQIHVTSDANGFAMVPTLYAVGEWSPNTIDTFLVASIQLSNDPYVEYSYFSLHIDPPSITHPLVIDGCTAVTVPAVGAPYVTVQTTAGATGAGGTPSTSCAKAASLTPTQTPLRQRTLAAGFLPSGSYQVAAATTGSSILTVPVDAQGNATFYVTPNGVAGNYTITVSSGGKVLATLPVANASATNAITFNPIAAVGAGAAPVALVATATSGDTVTFASLTPSVCTVSGATATILPGAAGICTIQATDPGNATYPAATPVSQSFRVNISRPDPSKDPEVIGLITAQTAAAQQFATVQLRNFNARLEQMHGDGFVEDQFGVSLTDGLGHDADEGQSFADADPALNRARDADSATKMAMTKVDRERDGRDKARDAKTKTAALDRAFSFWTAGAIQVGRLRNNNTASSTDLSTGGLSAGVDYRFNQFLSIGFGLGYGVTSADIGQNGTSLTGRNYDAVLYSSIRPTGYSFIDLVAGAGLLDFTSNRFITGGYGSASGRRSGYEVFGSVTSGVDFKAKSYTLTPYVRLEGKTGTLNAFNENAPAPWALHYDKETFSTASVNLGIKATLQLQHELEFISPFFRAEFQRDLVNNASAGVTYVDLVGTGTTYTVALPGSDASRVMLGIGADMTVNDFSLTLEYLNTFATGSTSDSSTFLFKATRSF